MCARMADPAAAAPSAGGACVTPAAGDFPVGVRLFPSGPLGLPVQHGLTAIHGGGAPGDQLAGPGDRFLGPLLNTGRGQPRVAQQFVEPGLALVGLTVAPVGQVVPLVGLGVPPVGQIVAPVRQIIAPVALRVPLIGGEGRLAGRIPWRPSQAAVLVSQVLRGTLICVPGPATPVGWPHVSEDAWSARSSR